MAMNLAYAPKLSFLCHMTNLRLKMEHDLVPSHTDRVPRCQLVFYLGYTSLIPCVQHWPQMSLLS